MSQRDRLDSEFRYILRRCPKLNDAERAFLCLISSYRYGCLLLQAEICELLGGWSERKLRRVISSLKKYELISVKYRAGKKTTISMASASKQAEFAKSYAHRPSMAEDRPATGAGVTGHWCRVDRPPMTGPILEKELERKLEKGFLNKRDSEGVDSTLSVPAKPGDVAKLLAKSVRAIKGIGVDA